MRFATYIRMPGQCKEAMAFYKDVFQGEILEYMLYTEENTDQEDMIGKIFHGEIEVNGFYLYFSDVDKTYDMDAQAYHVTVECDSLDQAKDFFDHLAAEGCVRRDLIQTPWGMYLANVQDKYGLVWDIVYA